MKRIYAYLIRHLLLLPCLALSAFAQSVAPPATLTNALTPIPQRLTLLQAEQLLLQRNLTVTAAKYQIEAGRAARLIAAFRPNPVLTIGAEQFNLSSRLFHDVARTDTNSAAANTLTIRYDQLLERGGKRALRTALAEAQLKANEAQMLDAVRVQLFQLRQAFTAATLARADLQLAEQTQQQYDQTIKLTAAKVENGDLAGVELYRVQAAALQYQQAVQQARTAYQQASRDVLNLLGARADEVQPTQVVQSATTDTQVIKAAYDKGGERIEPSANSLSDAPLQLEYELDDRPIAQPLEALRQLALTERPDVIAAQQLHEAAAQGVRLAEAQRTRDVTVGTFFQRVGSDHTVGVNVSLPLFRYNNGKAVVVQAGAQEQAAAALLQQAQLQAVTDVEKAWQAYLTARRTLEIYNATTLGRADKLKSIAAFSYKEGAINLLELLDAQRTYNQTINAYNQARADYQMALWQLEEAVGKPLR